MVCVREQGDNDDVLAREHRLAAVVNESKSEAAAARVDARTRVQVFHWTVVTMMGVATMAVVAVVFLYFPFVAVIVVAVVVADC